AGRKAIRNISIGSPLLWTDLKEVESQALSDIVSKNKRAVTIPVDQLSAVGYNIIAGDKVDIVATKESSCGGSNTVSIPNQAGAMRDLMDLNQSPIKVNESEGKSFVIMQNVLVLAIGQDYNTFSGRSQQQGKSFSSVTLEVSLEEALMLTHARQNATLSLILRNPASTQRFEFDKLPVVDCSNIRTNIAPKLDKIRASEENISEMSSQKQNNP
ncbi:MAG TPA: Flp pilus assembly protein CpaB, partial [Victivallales bacterium]|nr:Flp pilus assembly protein CpaB [Victivallales bacterium]